MADLAFCVHGHFYQPAREDPITGEIPHERGAMPFKNWNELIFSHCYKPNTELKNFEKISFNFGPTLLDWMAAHYPTTIDQIISQDRRNYVKYGVGNAMAQPYHHTILPLAGLEDKITQVRWGLTDFEHRFGHKATGMWLPETAVDLETLVVLADHGIEYTILAPWQAETNNLDFTQPYRVELPDNKEIAVFFYQQELSTRISFDPASTINADRFVTDLVLPQFVNDSKDKPRYVLVASDGELYGHHQPFRDKFLSRLLDGALANKDIQQAYPALWLRKHPPTETIKIKNATSWSCHHGVKRWSSVCDCTPNSQWKEDLRIAIEAVSKIVDREFYTELSRWVENVWEIRHRYISVLLKMQNEEAFILENIGKQLSVSDIKKIKYLLNAQLERQRMFTSCGWFFEDFDRIEPQNVVAYAAQAIYWIEQATAVNHSSSVLPLFEKISSWRNGFNGREVFAKQLEKAKLAYLHKEINVREPV